MPNRMISERLKDTRAGSFVKQMSFHLTKIFVIQWILIGIIYSIFRAFDLPNIPLSRVVPVGVLITLTTGILLQIYLKLKQETF